MKTRLVERGGHYYMQTLPDALDVLALIVSFLLIVAVMLLVWHALALLLRRPRQRSWRVFCILVIVFGVGSSVMYMLDVPGVFAVLSTQGGDVPVMSTIRTAFFTSLLLVLGRVLGGATRPVVVAHETP